MNGHLDRRLIFDKDFIFEELPNHALTAGDCPEVLARIPDGSVQTCITSPPYWGLRDYGTAEWEGGNPDCDHKDTGSAQQGRADAHDPEQESRRNTLKLYGATCRKCGALRIDNQLGLESTPEEYVGKMVAVFREVRRTLRDDGTLWLNLGDSYNGSGGIGGVGKQHTNQGAADRPDNRAGWDGLKPKDLVGIPWRVAFALQADGWYLRSDIIEEVEFYCPCGCGHVLEERVWRWSQDRELIWKKPNPMPESVTDRPTKSHEYLFLLSKSPKYYYDADAIRERIAEGTVLRMNQDVKSQEGSHRVPGKTNGPMKAVAGELRNKRSVWTVTTQPYKGAHFATFPPKLIKPCVLAGAPRDGLVLDPFVGSGTTVAVAKELNRRAIGIDLNREYLEMRIDQLAQEVLDL